MWKDVNLNYHQYLFYFLYGAGLVMSIFAIGIGIYAILKTIEKNFNVWILAFLVIVLIIVFWALLSTFHRAFYEEFRYFVKKVRVMDSYFEIMNLKNEIVRIDYERIADIIFAEVSFYGEKLFKKIPICALIVDQWIGKPWWFKVIVPRQYIQIDLPEDIGVEIMDRWKKWKKSQEDLSNRR